MKKVTIYSDGACSGNPGPGGYGVILSCNGVTKEFSRGYRRTTNNRMELLGAITGLEALKEPCQVTMVTDSRYVVKGMTEWIIGWMKQDWLNSQKKPVSNRDLWEDLLRWSRPHQIEWVWVKGHHGHPENEHCDKLARNALKGCR